MSAQIPGNSKYSDGKNLDIEDVIKSYIDIVLLSIDSINETVLSQKILKTGNVAEFFTVAAQLSFVGFGNANYRKYSFKGKELDLNDFFNKNNVIVGNTRQNNLSEDTLTPRRIIRVFKKQLYQLLTERQELSSYLYKKYTNQDPKMRTICFAGSEHFCKTQQEADYIYNAYCNLDESLKIQGKQAGISDRIKRVLNARNFKVRKI